jgi:hypothetical protein
MYHYIMIKGSPEAIPRPACMLLLICCYAHAHMYRVWMHMYECACVCAHMYEIHVHARMYSKCGCGGQVMCGQGELGSWAYGVWEIVTELDGHMQARRAHTQCSAV